MDRDSSALYCVSDLQNRFSILSWNLIPFLVFSRIKLDDFQVRVGSSRYAEDGYMIDVSRIVHHPNFAERTADYDISLLQLSKALIFTRKIQPIALPNANADIADGTLCATSGWGNLFLSYFYYFIVCYWLTFRQIHVQD